MAQQFCDLNPGYLPAETQETTKTEINITYFSSTTGESAVFFFFFNFYRKI